MYAAQLAVEKTLEERMGSWRAGAEDAVEEILDAIETLDVANANEIELSLLDGDQILVACKTLRDNTAVGRDWACRGGQRGRGGRGRIGKSKGKRRRRRRRKRRTRTRTRKRGRGRRGRGGRGIGKTTF